MVTEQALEHFGVNENSSHSQVESGRSLYAYGTTAHAGMSGAQELFEEVVKIAGDALVEVEHVATRHVVTLTRIDKIVGLCACIFGSAEEHERMLQNASGIVVAYDDLQTTFQVFGASD